MTTVKLYNLARVNTATLGTGTLTLGSAITGYLSFADAGVQDGDEVSYGIKDGSNTEVGRGTYGASGATLTRGALKSTNGDSEINITSGVAEVYITPLGEDFDFTGDLAASVWTSTDVASASTCDIGAATTPLVNITGTTTITSFGTSTDKLRRVRFATALILTHNATSLILPGGANITTAAGDEAEFSSDADGNWKCTKYLRASGLPLLPVLGTAAQKNTGTSGNTVPLLDGENTWSGQQTLAANLWLQNTSAPLIIQANSTNPAPQDALVGGFQAHGYNSSGVDVTYCDIVYFVGSNVAGSERGYFQLRTRNGSFGAATRFQIKEGCYHPSATGFDKGNNTINFGAVYDDNTLLTCMALAKEFRESKTVDLDKWDALVPDQVEPEKIDYVPVMEEVEAVETEHEETAFGLVAKKVRKQVKRQAVDFLPVYDEKGNGLYAIEQPVFETVVMPARPIKRHHKIAHTFKAMIDDGFDPRDPDQYFAKMLADEALPGMPTRQNWEHNSECIGEMFSRKWLAIEMLAIVSAAMWAKMKDHEARIKALETH